MENTITTQDYEAWLDWLAQAINAGMFEDDLVVTGVVEETISGFEDQIGEWDGRPE